MFGEPCSIEESKEILNNGGRLIVYGEPVYYDKSCGKDPCTWYRENIACANIAIEVEKIKSKDIKL